MPADHARTNPHDALFRRVLGRPEHAASQLRAILPHTLVAQLDLDRLTPVPGSFVDEQLRWRHTDLLFTTRTRDGREALVYLLMEHQSTPDPVMAWRLLRYTTRIWDRHRSEHPKGTTLPLVVPIVVYHGNTPWRYPTDLAGLLDLDDNWIADPAVAALIPRFPFLLDDLSAADEHVLRTRPLTAPVRVTLFLLLRAPANPDLAQELAAWVTDLRIVLDQPGGTATFEAS